jgi:hypothetical protein
MRIFNKLAIITLLTVLFYSPAALGMNAVSIDTEGLGNAAVKILEPFIKPFAEKLATRAATELDAAIDGLSKESACKALCVTGQNITCRKLLSAHLGTARVDTCKGRCQHKINLGAGYDLKIRFVEDTHGHRDGWSLKDCVATAKRTGLHTFNEDNKKSIAIYSKHDFDLAVKTIGIIAGLGELILLKGNVPENKGKTAKEIQEMVEKAKREKIELMKDFQEYVMENFGPQ